MYVLIIEDDKIVNQNICLLLRKEGMQSEMACTGKDGIELIKLYEYDLIILDLMLPDIQGLDVLKQMEEIEGQIGSIQREFARQKESGKLNKRLRNSRNKKHCYG